LVGGSPVLQEKCWHNTALLCRTSKASFYGDAFVEDNAKTPEKKLYVDEDWKAQVEREKEAAQQSEPHEAAHAKSGGDSAGAEMPLPTADLSFLIGTLFVQGAMALGMTPNPITKKQEVHREQVKFAIDLLAMLQQKTEGNRTPEETEDIEGALHQLRLAYLNAGEASKPQS
jgi:hypothetical protein